VVRELGPRFVLVENVQGLLSASGGEAFAEVLGDLAEQGFDAVWECVWARSVGAAHRRPRVFLLAGRPEALPIVEGLIGGGVPDADDGTRGSELGVQSGDPSAVVAGSGAEPVADPDGVGCGERWCEDAEGQLDRAAEGDRGGGFDWGPYEEAVRRWEWLVGPPPAPLDGRGRLSPPFVEWLMGFPSGWIDGLKRDAALHALGNAVVPQQGAFALVRLFRAFHALCASDRVW
jgi:DNA (cytosine-5)-methyltransferase 1